MKILIFGASGMNGKVIYDSFSNNANYQVYGTIREVNLKKFFNENFHKNLLPFTFTHNEEELDWIFQFVKPDLVINCIGVIKHKALEQNKSKMYEINALFPKTLKELCNKYSCRMIHFSTDCVFLGTKGNYNEESIPDSIDDYGKSKLEGEICDEKNVITIRLSLIGHELNSNLQLIDWFLSQEKKVNGYKKAIFSGITNIELFNILEKYIINNNSLNGLYHVSANPIDKFSILDITSKIYKKDIIILPDETVTVDRSLDSTRFKKITSYIPPSWEEMIRKLYENSRFYNRN